MDLLTNKLTIFLQKKKLIDDDQILWCNYMIRHRLMDVISLLWLIPIGSLISPWYISLAFVLSYRFLRSRTGGYHAKSLLGCMLASTVMQLVGVLLIRVVKDIQILFYILLISSLIIITIAPANNAELHLSQQEINALFPRIRRRLLLLWLLVCFFYCFNAEIAVSIIFGTIATALLLLLSKIGIGVN